MLLFSYRLIFPLRKHQNRTRRAEKPRNLQGYHRHYRRPYQRQHDDEKFFNRSDTFQMCVFRQRRGNAIHRRIVVYQTATKPYPNIVEDDSIIKNALK